MSDKHGMMPVIKAVSRREEIAVFDKSYSRTMAMFSEYMQDHGIYFGYLCPLLLTIPLCYLKTSSIYIPLTFPVRCCSQQAQATLPWPSRNGRYLIDQKGWLGVFANGGNLQYRY